MKEFNLLVFVTQLGLSVALPLAGFTVLSVWLRNRFGLGPWIIYAGIGVGILCAVDGFRMTLKAMERMSRDKREDEPPPVSFNEHH